MGARAKAIEVMAYAFYVQDTGMPDCWRTESDGARGWYREMAEAALDALLAATQEQTGEPLVLLGPELVAYHSEARSPYWFNRDYIKANPSVFSDAYPVYRRAGSPDA